MRRAAIALATVATIGGLPASAAQAQAGAPTETGEGFTAVGEYKATTSNLFCLDFVLFCDGLEIRIEGDAIRGIWRNRVCQGIDSPLVGVIEDGIPNPCVPEPGRVGLACLPEFGCDQLDGDDEWYFVLNEPNGILDFGLSENGVLPPPGGCAIVGGISYQVLPGPCPFGPDGSDAGQPWISSEHAFR